MDDSISKALIMTAGVLIAIIVIGFVTLSFREISLWAETSESERIVKQNAKFNKEYEVYDKDIMYGVDVISCLNKALSNNEAIEGRYSEAIDESYEVQVVVNLKNNILNESLEVYYLPKELGSLLDEQNKYPNGEGVASVKLKNVGFRFVDSTVYTKEFSNFDQDTPLKTATNKTVKLSSKTLTLTADSGEHDEIIKLLDCANTLTEVVKNPDQSSYDKWTRAEFKSALYDLKTRKFTCVGLEYSEQGRVNRITFREI